MAALARPAPAPDELPRGRLAGSFLHEIIQHLPLDTLARAPAFDDWRQLPEVAALFERMRRRHDQQVAHIAHAQRLVHTALTVPVRLGDTVDRGLGRAAHPTREMEFLYPIPERRHPTLRPAPAVDAAGEAPTHGVAGEAPAWRIERGVVKGFIDYLFEHDGRVYVCDWKSDDAATAGRAAALTAHCESDYALQAELYTWAAVRLARAQRRRPLRPALRRRALLLPARHARRRSDRRRLLSASALGRRSSTGSARCSSPPTGGAVVSSTFEPGPLSPLGTARLRLAAADAAIGGETNAARPSLLAELRDADLGPESLFLAWQIARAGRDAARPPNGAS